MKPGTIIQVGIGILILVITCFIFIIIYGKDTEAIIRNAVKQKQTVKSIYKPPSSPKSHQIIIPKKLFQTWHSKTLPPKMQENVAAIQRQNPELEYFLYDDNDCANYIKKHFSDEVVDAYNKLLPGAYKADLWRYCVMYIDGGVYLDIKYKCVDGFKFIDIMDREHFVLDRYNFWKPGTYGIYNAFIVAKRENPVLMKAIQAIVRNTQTNFYGYNCLYPTGPGLLGELYFGNINGNINMLNDFEMVHNHINSTAYIIYENQIILIDYDEYRKEQKINQKRKHYSELWRQRAIYAQ